MKEFIYKHFYFILSIVVNIFAYIYCFYFASDFVFDIKKLLSTILLCILVGLVENDAYRRGINDVISYINNRLQEDNNIDETK